MARVLFSAQTSTAGGKLYFLATLSLVKYQRALPAAVKKEVPGVLHGTS